MTASPDNLSQHRVRNEFGEPFPLPSRMSDPNLSSFIWSVADLLRGDYKQSEYGKVILPFTILRRLDCVLESTKDAVLAEKASRRALSLPASVNVDTQRPPTFMLQSTPDQMALCLADPASGVLRVLAEIDKLIAH